MLVLVFALAGAVLLLRPLLLFCPYIFDRAGGSTPRLVKTTARQNDSETGFRGDKRSHKTKIRVKFFRLPGT